MIVKLSVFATAGCCGAAVCCGATVCCCRVLCKKYSTDELLSMGTAILSGDLTGSDAARMRAELVHAFLTATGR